MADSAFKHPQCPICPPHRAPPAPSVYWVAWHPAPTSVHDAGGRSTCCVVPRLLSPLVAIRCTTSCARIAIMGAQQQQQRLQQRRQQRRWRQLPRKNHDDATNTTTTEEASPHTTTNRFNDDSSDNDNEDDRNDIGRRTCSDEHSQTQASNQHNQRKSVQHNQRRSVAATLSNQPFVLI